MTFTFESLYENPAYNTHGMISVCNDFARPITKITTHNFLGTNMTGVCYQVKADGYDPDWLLKIGAGGGVPHGPNDKGEWFMVFGSHQLESAIALAKQPTK